MRGKQKLHRMYAKHRAAKYAGKQKRLMEQEKKKRLFAMALLLVGTTMLYCRELPLPEFPEAGVRTLEKLATEENRKVGEEEVFSVRYAGTQEDGDVLRVRHAEGEIPEFIPPVEETVPVSVKNILEERFGDLEHVTCRSFLSNYYIEDSSTKATEDDFRITELAEYDLTVDKKDKPQILIFHTHTSEGYADSREGVADDTVFDRKADGTDDRNNAYNNALPVITSILEKYPSIEVVIDLHRDSGDARTSVINGVSTAKVMLFNGLCRTKDGPISYYSNPNLQGNLAFSLHLQITGNELYPGLMHRIYLKSYRYNMHLMEKYLLVELGTHKNTVAEAKNAMVPFAKTIATVLSGEE